jgi:hypothetical protein
LIESNAGNYLAAIDQLRAMQVPHGRRAYGYWTALAYAFTQIDKRNDALAAAREALSEARTEDERQRAQQLAYVASTDLKAQFFRDSQGRLQVTTTRVEHGATGWNPFVEPTDQMRRKNGQLSDVLCTAGKLTGFRVLTTGGSLILDVPDPSHVLIENGPNEYYCGVMQKKAVRVDYAVLGSAGAGKNILRGMTFGDGPEK